MSRNYEAMKDYKVVEVKLSSLLEVVKAAIAGKAIESSDGVVKNDELGIRFEYLDNLPENPGIGGYSNGRFYIYNIWSLADVEGCNAESYESLQIALNKITDNGNKDCFITFENQDGEYVYAYDTEEEVKSKFDEYGKFVTDWFEEDGVTKYNEIWDKSGSETFEEMKNEYALPYFFVIKVIV